MYSFWMDGNGEAIARETPKMETKRRNGKEMWRAGSISSMLGDSHILATVDTTFCDKGASRYDVRIGGGRGSWKSGRSKGGCVNFILEIRSKCGQGGRGSKNQKILRMSLMDAPLAERAQEAESKN